MRLLRPGNQRWRNGCKHSRSLQAREEGRSRPHAGPALGRHMERGSVATCHACQMVGHYKGSKACSKSGKGKAVVNAVGNYSQQEVTESANSVTEEQVCASKTKLEMVMIDHSRQAPAKQVKLLVDSGVRKTLINEEIWKKMQKKVGGLPDKTGVSYHVFLVLLMEAYNGQLGITLELFLPINQQEAPVDGLRETEFDNKASTE